ncbi:MAG: phage tail tape measure protein [Deltaproteobacteria bacterium]|nr:phage tail tape measure protein [Deltaproteobacteria bacterium]
MADITKTIEIVFGGRNDLTKTLGQFERDFNGIDSVIDSVAAPLAGVADKVMMVDAALAALAVGGLALALKTAGDFNGQFGEITTLLTETGAPIEQFRQDIKNYSLDSVKSIEDINAAIYAAISAGIDYKDSVAFVAEAEKLAVAGVSDLGDTTKVLVSTLNAYGESADKATQYSDLLFQTVRLGQTTMPELSSSIAQVTNIAAAAGIPFGDLSAAIATLTAKGMPTAEAITALKGTITAIIDPPQEAAKAAAALGIQFDAQALKSKGLEGVIKDVNAATGGNIALTSQLFGNIRGLSGVLALGAEDAALFSKNLKEMENAGGSTAIAYAKVAGEFENINQRILNSFKVTLINVGEKIMPEYTQIGTALAGLLKEIKVGVDTGAFDPLFDYLKEVGSDIAAWVQGVSKAFPDAIKDLDYDKFIKAFDDLAESIGAFFGDLDLTNADDLADALQTVIDMVSGLLEVTAGMADAFRPFASAIVDFLQGIANGDEEAQKMTGTLLGLAKVIDMTCAGFAVAILALDKYGVNIEATFNLISGGAQMLWNGLQLVGNSIQGLFVLLEGSVLKFVEIATFGLANLSPAFKNMMETVEESGRKVSAAIDENGEDAARGLKKMIEGFSNLDKTASTAKQTVDEIPQEKEFSLSAETEQALIDIGKAAVEMDKIKPTVNVEAKADSDSLEKAKNTIIETLPDGTTSITYIEVDENKLRAAQGKVEDALPKEKKIDVSIETARIKEQSEIIQQTIEWDAKVNIAQIEAATKEVEAMFSSIDTGIQSTGSLMSDMFSALTQSSPYQSFIKRQIEEEAARREETFALQKELVTGQLKLLDMKVKALERGDNLIKISADGLKPHLEMILWEVLEACQIRANESSAEFLIGYGT